jgi:hypothetical protein
MKHFFDHLDGPPGLSPEKERELLIGDIEHLRKQCSLYWSEDATGTAAGVWGLMSREKTRLYAILHSM